MLYLKQQSSLAHGVVAPTGFWQCQQLPCLWPGRVATAFPCTSLRRVLPTAGMTGDSCTL